MEKRYNDSLKVTSTTEAELGIEPSFHGPGYHDPHEEVKLRDFQNLTGSNLEPAF